MKDLLTRLLANHGERLTFLKYVFASVLSLGVDLAVFFGLIGMDVPAVWANTVSYSCGIVTHWLISSRIVFRDTTSRDREVRTYQKLMFVGSALLGLFVSSAIVATASAMHMAPHYAKGVAIVASFAVTWIARRNIVFGERAAATTARLGRTLGQKFRP